VPLFENGGRYKGAFGVVTDITERVMAGRILEQRVKDRTHELTTLLEVSRDIAVIQELETVINRILERLKTVVNYHTAIILVEKEDHWSILAEDQPSISIESDPLELSPPEVQALVKEFELGEPVLIRNSDLDKANYNGFGTLATRLSRRYNSHTGCWLGVPLLEKGNLSGALVLGCVEAEASTDQVKIVAAFASQIAIAIENNHLYQQVRETAVIEERNRLARDLHDSVTQALFSASLIADILPKRLRRDPDLALQSGAELRRLIRGALAEMRTMLLELRPASITSTPLGDLLSQLTEAVTSRTDVQFQLFIDNLPPLPAEIQTTFYRIAQEALNNVIKHSQARQVIVSLSATPPIDARSVEGWKGVVQLIIRDDGIGFASGDRAREHMGLGIMRERAAAINAIFTIVSQPGEGTVVTLVW
jgi:signal transduction histidine kinase